MDDFLAWVTFLSELEDFSVHQEIVIYDIDFFVIVLGNSAWNQKNGGYFCSPFLYWSLVVQYHTKLWIFTTDKNLVYFAITSEERMETNIL